MKLGGLKPPETTGPEPQREPDELFGRFLVRRGCVTPQVLEQTAESQVIFGRRLGTTLLELGHLQEAELERQLSAFLGAPLPPAEWLEAPAAEALARMPADRAQELGALPLREDGTLHVALLDPHDPETVEAVQRATGRRVTPYVLCERHLRDLLERHLGIAQRERALEVETASDWRPVERAEPRRAAPAPPSPDREALGLVPLPAEAELIDRATFDALQSDRPGAGDDPREVDPDHPAAPPTSLAALEAALAAAERREDAVQAALRIARRHAEAAALFAVGEDALTAVGVSTPDRREAARDISVPADAACLLADVAESGLVHRGEIPSEGIDGLVFHALGRQRAREVLVLPVRVGGRVVSLLCVDAGADPVPVTSQAALERLCELLGASYERLIEAKALRYR